MHDIRVARRYAGALFALAVKHNLVSAVEQDLAGIASLIENDPQFRDFLFSPHVNRENKLTISEKLFSDRVTALTMQAIRLMLSKNREPELIGVRDEFVELRRQKEGAILVRVATTEPLGKPEQKKLIDKLMTITGKTVETQFDIDPRLIGGIRVTFDGTVLDGSLRGNLDALREKLHHDVLKQS